MSVGVTVPRTIFLKAFADAFEWKIPVSREVPSGNVLFDNQASLCCAAANEQNGRCSHFSTIEHRGRFSVSGIGQSIRGLRGPKPRGRGFTPSPRFGEGTCRRQTAGSACHYAGDGLWKKSLTAVQNKEHRGRFSVQGVGLGIRGLRGPKPRGRGFQPLPPGLANGRPPTDGGFRLPVKTVCAPCRSVP